MVKIRLKEKKCGTEKVSVSVLDRRNIQILRKGKSRSRETGATKLNSLMRNNWAEKKYEKRKEEKNGRKAKNKTSNKNKTYQ